MTVMSMGSVCSFSNCTAAFRRSTRGGVAEGGGLGVASALASSRKGSAISQRWPCHIGKGLLCALLERLAALPERLTTLEIKTRSTQWLSHILWRSSVRLNFCIAVALSDTSG